MGSAATVLYLKQGDTVDVGVGGGGGVVAMLMALIAGCLSWDSN